MAFYQDLEFRRGNLFIRSTATRIPLTWDFAKSFVRQFGLFLIVCGAFVLRRLNPLRKRHRIGFYPGVPKPWYKIWNITRFMGLRYCEDIQACDVLFYFEDTTESPLDTDFIGVPNKRALNAYCTDISKDRVARTFEDVFGYSLTVDPTTYHGKAVRKSERNAAHDGLIVECPIPAREDGMAYQRLIENSYDGRTVQDIRVAVVGSQIPLVYIKERDITHRFANSNSSARLCDTADALTDEEVRQILAFTARMGLDFGGLDVLRDRASGKIFIVDVNKTCMGPPIPLTFREKYIALDRLGRALITLIEEHRS